MLVVVSAMVVLLSLLLLRSVPWTSAAVRQSEIGVRGRLRR